MSKTYDERIVILHDKELSHPQFIIILCLLYVSLFNVCIALLYAHEKKPRKCASVSHMYFKYQNAIKTYGNMIQKDVKLLIFFFRSCSLY